MQMRHIELFLQCEPFYDIWKDIERMNEMVKYQQLTKPSPPWSRSFKGKKKVKK